MKALIWIASILITSIVVVMLNAVGIHLGGIPTMIVYAPLFFITPKLCKKWDEYKESQKENLPEYAKESFDTANISNNVTHKDEVRFCRKCGEKLNNSQFCSKCGTEVL